MGRGVFAGGSVALHGAGLASFPTLNPNSWACCLYPLRRQNVKLSLSGCVLAACGQQGLATWGVCVNPTGELLCSLRNS